MLRGGQRGSRSTVPPFFSEFFWRNSSFEKVKSGRSSGGCKEGGVSIYPLPTLTRTYVALCSCVPLAKNLKNDTIALISDILD